MSDPRYAQSGQGATTGRRLHLPHSLLRVEFTDDQRGRLDVLLGQLSDGAVIALARTVAGSLMARTLEGEARRLRALWGGVSEGEDVFTADQVRHLLQVTKGEPFLDIQAALRMAWEGEEVMRR